ncbi:hypothetical protein CYMTET_42194 [Cymbomonas tetramitiformis]|uniref:Uncharacterized protein n=1 Tax=Cymbomonas tetramitiformis TaxID=36881 RepID=A0AAE0C4L3_9CHLO|nr:hypothetical protein CYMTET_42194 [Cymbomonas tetramitiformis]
MGTVRLSTYISQWQDPATSVNALSILLILCGSGWHPARPNTLLANASHTNYTRDGYTAGTNITVAGTTLPWNKLMCLTPSDLQPLELPCPEGQPECQYYSLSFVYEEINANEWEAVPGWQKWQGSERRGEVSDVVQYTNAFHKDGESMYDQPIYDQLWMGESRMNVVNFTVGPYSSSLEGEAWWGPIDSRRHRLTLNLNVEDTNVSAGYLEWEYCGFDNSPCACNAAVNGGEGITIGVEERLLEWGNGSYIGCLVPEDILYAQDGEPSFDGWPWYEGSTVREVIPLTMYIEELWNMYGEGAAKLGFTVVEPPFYAQLYFGYQGWEDCADRYNCDQLRRLTGIQSATMRSHEIRTLSYNLPIPELETDVYSLHLFLDPDHVVNETHLPEGRHFYISFQTCWPPNLILGLNKLRVYEELKEGEKPTKPNRASWGTDLCLSSTQLQSWYAVGNNQVTENRTYFILEYEEHNNGYLPAGSFPNGGCGFEPERSKGGCAGWKNTMLLDGIKIQETALRPYLAANSKRFVNVTLDMGPPDDKEHVLEFRIDAFNAVPQYDSVSTTQDYLKYTTGRVHQVTIRFCDFGIDVEGGDEGMLVGEREIAVPWGDSICITEKDEMQYGYLDNLYLHMHLQYQIINRGPQDAYVYQSEARSWKTSLYYDGELLQYTTGGRLGSHGTSRWISDNRTMGLILGPIDTEIHTFTLKVDEDQQLLWSEPRGLPHPTNRSWSIKVMFCTEALRAANNGTCGCSGDLTVGDSVTIGKQEVAWGSHVCLGREDLYYEHDAYDNPASIYTSDIGTYALHYTEANVNPRGRLMEENWRNILLWDDATLQYASEPRPELQLGDSRQVWWNPGAVLTRDKFNHTLSLVLNAPISLALPDDPADSEGWNWAGNTWVYNGVAKTWHHQREVAGGLSIYNLSVSFCGLEATMDPSPGRSVIIGLQEVSWGDLVCVHSTDVAAKYYGRYGYGHYQYGAFFSYRDMNRGLEAAKLSYWNYIYLDDQLLFRDEIQPRLYTNGEIATGEERLTEHDFVAVPTSAEVPGVLQFGREPRDSWTDTEVHTLTIVSDATGIYSAGPRNFTIRLMYEEGFAAVGSPTQSGDTSTYGWDNIDGTWVKNSACPFSEFVVPLTPHLGSPVAQLSPSDPASEITCGAALSL